MTKIVYVKNRATGIVHGVADTHEAVTSPDFEKSSKKAYVSQNTVGKKEQPSLPLDGEE